MFNIRHVIKKFWLSSLLSSPVFVAHVSEFGFTPLLNCDPHLNWLAHLKVIGLHLYKKEIHQYIA